MHILNPQEPQLGHPPGKPPTFRQSTPVFTIPSLETLPPACQLNHNSTIEIRRCPFVGLGISSGSSVQILQSQLPNGTLLQTSTPSRSKAIPWWTPWSTTATSCSYVPPKPSPMAIWWWQTLVSRRNTSSASTSNPTKPNAEIRLQPAKWLTHLFRPTRPGAGAGKDGHGAPHLLNSGR